MPRHRPLQPGEPAPWFTARCTSNAAFHFGTVAGRYVVLSFFESSSRRDSRPILQEIRAAQDVFDDVNACFFGVSVDADDERLGRVREALPGIRFFWDFDFAVSQAYGATSDSGYRAHTLVLDERLRVVEVVPFDEHPQSHASRILEALAVLPRIAAPALAALQAPVLVVPRVFEPALCQRLIGYYDERGGEKSGFMREKDGKTIAVVDDAFKRRRDQEIHDAQLRAVCMHRIHDHLVPEIHKAFQFLATRIERYIVACYDAETGGYFHAHRDNTTKGTAHRRFAVSLNLNTGEYEGGQVRFPEFGQQLYTAPAGGAVVFSCSLLHEAMPVTGGRRYAFLPFLYDDAAARIRQQNQQFLETDPTSKQP